MSDCANDKLTRSLFICFSAFLTTEILPNKRPLPKWKKSLRQDLSTETESKSTGRVFFESGGAQAWAAYEAVRPSAIHCQGQADKRHCFAELDRQSLEFRADLARMVGAVTPHPTVADLIAPMAQEALRLLDRRGDAESSILVASAPTKRRRTDESSREASLSARPSIPALPPPTPPASRHYENNTLPAIRHHENASPVTGGQAGETAKVDEYAGADIQGLFELVPPYMAEATKKYKKNGTPKAKVRMLFPVNDLDLPCAITFDILDEKVEYLASKLFDAHLERDGEARVFYYADDERKAEVGPGCTFLSCTIEAILSLFGRLIALGNAACPRRQTEASRHITRSVTMELLEAGKGALITLSLASIEGSQIFEKLYA